MNNTHILHEYYKENLYPFALIHRILTMNRKNQSGEARTIALQYPGDTNVYASYDYKRETAQALRSRMLVSPQKVPESMHLGLFRENFGSKLVIGKKELVFDLDITDFERYCACRGSKNLCAVCWIQMQGASLILEHLLEHTLGYKEANRLWIFSGGKGLHCFINAPMALCLGDKERERLHKRLFIRKDDDKRLAAFVIHMRSKYPEFVKEVEHFFISHMIKTANIFALPPFLIRDDPPIEETFERFALRHLRAHHGPLASLVRGTWESIGSSPEKEEEELKRQRVEHNISVRKWRALQQLETMREEDSGAGYKASDFLMFRLLYPMIDAGPFKIGHQIKLPFSIHHRTKNIALPLAHSSIMKLDITRDTLSLSTLCLAKRNKQPLPTSFTTGLEEMERWIEAYPFI